MYFFLRNWNICVLFILISCHSKSQDQMPTDNCLVFDEAPKNLSSIVNIAAPNEPGERLTVKGTVFQSDGKTPARNVVMYFYHTNTKGIYAKRGSEDRSSFAWWHGYHRGWLRTNERGEYTIHTVKPSPYPTRIEPAHIHCLVKSPEQKLCYYIGDFVFKNDPLANEHYWYNVERNGHRRYGGMELVKRNGVWEGKRDINLYPQYDKIAINSGLNIGENCPAFDPKHVTGPDKGSQACPMCKYGYRQGLMAWINNDNWQNVTALAQYMEQQIQLKGLNNVRAFIIYIKPAKMNDTEAENKLRTLAGTARLKNVALLYVPSATDKTSSFLYRINPDPTIKNTLFIYKRRQVHSKFINFEASGPNLNMLLDKLNQP
jgi:protocatechuate 3,4-dioxygenase beta subunit